MDGRASASARPTRRGRRPWHVRTLLVREPGDLAVWPAAACRRSASGRRGAVADDARTREVRPRRSSDEADEQSRATGGGAGGAKGGDQGERGPAKHAPGAGPGKRVTGAGPRTASRKAKEEGDGSPRSSTMSAPTMLRTAFFALKRDAAPGVDGLTWQDYEADLERRLEDLHARVQRGAYRAQPSRRRYIPKPDGGSARSRSRRWKTRSSRERRSRC